MLIVDPFSDETAAPWRSVADAVTGMATPVLTGDFASYAAVFFPMLKQPDPTDDNRINLFSPCGAVAGVFARTDAQRGVWKAPAGIDAALWAFPTSTCLSPIPRTACSIHWGSTACGASVDRSRCLGIANDARG